MANKKKILTIGQLKYRKRLKDLIMKQLIDGGEAEGVRLSKSQLLQVQKYVLKKVSEDHGYRVRMGKEFVKRNREK